VTARRDAVFGLALDHGQGMLVMEALADMPWRRVHALIGRLHEWGSHAFGAAGAMPSQPFALDLDELELTLEALGELPHRRVHALIASLRRQLDQLRQAQLPGRAANG
jgi:hypothetical protein